MAKRKWWRRFHLERFEARQMLAATTPDIVELVSSADVYEDASPVQQRVLVGPRIVDALGLPAYDLRTDLPGDQTVAIAVDNSYTDPVQVTRAGDRMARMLVDPAAVYEVTSYWNEDTAAIILDAYDAIGNFLGRYQLGVENNEVDGDEGRGVHSQHGYIGDPNMRGAMFVKLPSQTHLIEVRSAFLTKIGFANDAFDSGVQVITWNEERYQLSNRTLDVVESDQPILVQSNKTYTLDASVTVRGATTSGTHSVGYAAYDTDGLRIEPKHVERFGSATDTRLASDLKPGDTFFDLVDAAGWSNLAGPETRSLAFYGYADSQGRVHADYSYTRHVASDAVLGLWGANAIVGNRITLSLPWNGPMLRAGTAVRNTVDAPNAGLFSVVADQQLAPIQAQANVSGFRKQGLADSSAFPPGTVSFRPAARLNETVQASGMAQLSYRVSTRSSASAIVDTVNHTRSVLIDVLANDTAALSAGTILSSVTNAKYGTVQIVAGTSGARAQVRYTTGRYFVGTDRFDYTLQTVTGQLITESVTVSSLGGNLEANPSLQQTIAQYPSTIGDIRSYGVASFFAMSGSPVVSRPDNNNYLSKPLEFLNTTLTYSLTKGPANGTLSINADGTFAYQSLPGYVGWDMFEYVASNGARSSTLVGYFLVLESADEVDRHKVGSIAQALLTHESVYKQLFHSNGATGEYDANGVPLLSWRVRILPFLGFQTLYSQFRMNEPWNSANNLPLLSQMPDVFRNSSDTTLSSSTRFQAIKAGPAGNTLHFFNNNGSPRATRLSNVTDGIGNTLSVVRAGIDKAVPWTKPDDLPFDSVNPLATLGTSPEAAIPVAFVDAKSALMPKNVLASTFTSMATIAQTAGEAIVDGPTLMRAWSEQLSNPAVHARSYDRSQSERLRMVGIAMRNYESAFKALPLWGTLDANGNRLLSWRVLLLPFMGHTQLYNQFRLNEPWDSPHNLTLLNSMPDFYRSATDLSSSNTTRLRLLDGPGTLYSSAVTRPRYSIVTDGLANTLFAVEAGSDKAVPWTMPETLPLGADFLASLGQLNEAWLRALTVDGTPMQLPIGTPNIVLQAIATYNKGELEGRIPAWGVGSVKANMRMLGLGILNFESGYRRLPINLYGDSPFTKKTTTPTLSWRVAILPYLDEMPLYLAFRFDEPWDSPHNLSLLPRMPSIFRSQGLPIDSSLTRMQMFSGARTILRKDGVALRMGNATDGTFNTLAVVEAGIDKAVPWTKPSDLDGDVIDLWRELGNVGHAFSAIFLDSDVRLVTQSYQRYLSSLVLRDDGGNVPALEATQRIVVREGELAAIDMPNNAFSLESPSLFQFATAPLSPTDLNAPQALRLTMRAIDNAIADGVRVTRLTVNGRVVEIVIIDDEGLSLTSNPSSISEAGGQTTLTVTRPNLDLQSPLVVQVDSSDRTRLSVPASVTIPAGARSVSFTATAIDNVNPGDSGLVSVTATASGLGASSILIRIVDDESLLIRFTPTSISEFGGVTTGTVSRLGGLGAALVVTLQNDQPGRVSLPDQVTIPAGETSVTFQATAIDDQFYNADTVVSVFASAQDYADTTGSFTITDFEAIGLALSSDKISETDEVMTMTLTREANSQGQPIAVTLHTDRPDKIQLPSSVVIPANAQRVTVQLRTIDNRLLDGLTHVRINAMYGVPGSQYAAGSALVDVIDHEALSLTMTPPVLSEKDGQSRGRLTRDNTDLDRPLTVALTTNYPELVNVPATVTIPAGAEFVEFDVDAIDNDQLAPDTRVRLEAIHAAYLPESMTFIVSDYEPLALSFESSSGKEGTTITGIVSRSIGNLDQSATVLLRSLDESEVELPLGVVIPAGQRSASFTAKLLRDRQADGSQSATVVAESAGYVSASTQLTILDDEFINVILTESQAIRESTGVVMARLTRSDLSSETALTISVSSSNTSVAHASSTVQIDAHQASIEFPIFIVDDRVVDGTQSVRLSFAVQDAAIAGALLDLQVEDDERPWHNLANPLDVNHSGTVTPLDALLIINYLNQHGSKATSNLPPADDNQPLSIDTSHDDFLSAIDALLVINHLNTNANGEGELAWWEELAVEQSKRGNYFLSFNFLSDRGSDKKLSDKK